MAVRDGEFQDVAFRFTQKGESIEGKLYGDYGSSPISEGRVSGEEIRFVILAPEQAGNQINDTKFRFTGSLKGGEIELTRERETSTNAGNAGGAQVRNSTKQSIRLRRLL